MEKPLLEPLLDVNQIGIQFGGLKAVDNFSMKISRGSLNGLIGPNGAGKTTIFNLLTGVYRPNSGTITLDGENLIGLKAHRIARLGLARTFQNIRLFRNLSVVDNIMIAGHFRAKEGLFASILRTKTFREEEEKLRNEALELLDIFDMRSKADWIASSLPYGDSRKLEIVRALFTHPKILMLDEPAAGMNNSETQGLMRIIADIRKRFGLTILLIEHDMKLVMTICENIHVLDHGVKIAEGTASSIQNNPKVIEAYLGASDETES